MISNQSPISEYFFEDLPRQYHVDFLAQEANVFHGIADEGQWVNKGLCFETVKIADLAGLKTQYAEHNLYRSWMIYDENKQEIGRMPAYLDIDGNHCNPDLTAARNAAEWVINATKALFKIENDSIRVVFSGQKGFHVEVSKHGFFSKEWYEGLASQHEYIAHFGHSLTGGLTLDKQWNRFGWKKNYVRLNDTLNTTDQGTPPRRCFTMTVEAFFNTDVSEMISISEK